MNEEARSQFLADEANVAEDWEDLPLPQFMPKIEEAVRRNGLQLLGNKARNPDGFFGVPPGRWPGEGTSVRHGQSIRSWLDSQPRRSPPSTALKDWDTRSWDRSPHS